MKQSTAIALLAAAVLLAAVVLGLIYWRTTGVTTVTNRPAGVPALPADAKTFDGWAMVCGNDAQGAHHCTLLMRVIDDKTKTLLLRLAVQRGPQGRALLTILLPPNVQVPAGVQITPGAAPAFSVPILNCTAQACNALGVLDDNLVKIMGAAQTSTVQFVTGGGQPLKYTLPTKGFDRGYAAWLAEDPAPAAPPASPSAAPAAPAAP